MARSLAVLALTGLAAVAAQTTTISVFLPMFDEQAIEASVVAVDADKTTFFIACPTDVDSTECGVAEGGQTVIYGPTTFALSYQYEDEEYGSYDEEIGCVLVPTKDLASCSVEVTQSYDGTTTATSTSVSTSGYLDEMIPITVTAGANKLGDDSSSDDSTQLSLDKSSPTVTDDAATATGSAASDSSAANSASATASGSDSASATSTPTASDNAAGAMVTQNAILAGAAVLVGGAMLL